MILIGNGPSVLKYEFGKLIDKHTDVVRFNNFFTVSYEKYVGQKTTIWVRNNTQSVLDRSESFEQVILCRRPTEPNEKPYHTDVIKNWHEKFELPNEKWLSTGFMSILHFLETYPVVYIHGFDFFKSETHHYFQSTSSNKRHDGYFESNYVSNLIKSGKVITLTSKTLLL